MAGWPPPGDYEIIFDPSFQEAQAREMRIQRPPYAESLLELETTPAGSGAPGEAQTMNEAPPRARNCRLVFNKITKTVRLEIVPEPYENIVGPVTQIPARGTRIDLEIAGSSSQAGNATDTEANEDTVEAGEGTVHGDGGTVEAGEGTVARTGTWELSASELTARLANMEHDRKRAEMETARRFGELGLQISDSENDED